jgi:hypothetical protein
MTILIFKLLTTPVCIGGVTLASRRWGPSVGGLVMGLPLTSGPVSVFLALQYGPAFAAQAAAATLAGQTSGCAFTLAYGFASRRWNWPVCVLVSLLTFIACTTLLNRGSWSLVSGAVALLAAILVVARIIPARDIPAAPVRPPSWDLPARMVVATAFVVALTAAAQGLGPKLSGLIAPFPIYAPVLGAFTHHRQGSAAATQLLRGNAVGALSFISFFLIAGCGLGRMPLGAVYLLAALGALATGGLLVLARRLRTAG